MNRDTERRIIDPIEITPTFDPTGSDIVIHYGGITYRYHVDDFNPKTVQTTAWNYLKEIMLKEEKL